MRNIYIYIYIEEKKKVFTERNENLSNGEKDGALLVSPFLEARCHDKRCFLIETVHKTVNHRVGLIGLVAADTQSRNGKRTLETIEIASDKEEGGRLKRNGMKNRRLIVRLILGRGLFCAVTAKRPTAARPAAGNVDGTDPLQWLTGNRAPLPGLRR